MPTRLDSGRLNVRFICLAQAREAFVDRRSPENCAYQTNNEKIWIWRLAHVFALKRYTDIELDYFGQQGVQPGEQKSDVEGYLIEGTGGDGDQIEPMGFAAS